ncbi:hypothetical protein OTU49_002907 [Cherax quadricarinatus]|uniref:PDZ domain-containing protein n=1 Tax=Cherax quadricarinatus TaxID=27406 RepID=A0AAW0XBL2_CHEQU
MSMRAQSMHDGFQGVEAPPAHALASSTHYGSSSGASSMGGGRIKLVRLVRRNGESYGFSLRGGREHGTGFFISHVEPGSEAFLQGLRAGDQVLKVNNLCVEQALHREVTAIVQSKSSVVLKIKSTGIIPLKEHRGDPLTWLIVDDDEELSDNGTDTYSQSLPSCSANESDLESFHPQTPSPSPQVAVNDGYAKVFLSCCGKVGLGCSICKGPTEKPGIFVQSVRVGGVAKNAGLRPGDQILACNDISFAHLEFAEAVYVLKSSPRLALDVLRGAGLDLVAGESSGYNSSASSVAGDQTPPSSSSDPRDSDHSITTRLSAVSRHLNLDRTRGWREIESEWAEAEAEEKRRQLQSSQKTLKTRAQRDASHRLSTIGSRSLCNLSAALREEDEQRTSFRDGSPPYTRSVSSTRTFLMPTHGHYKPKLRSTRSSNDVTEDTSHKIALVTSADPHVNNIVVTGGPKDERDAVFRLEQLSSPSASRTSTLSSGTSQVTVRSSSGSGSSPSIGSKAASPVVAASLVEQQLRELREEQRRLKEEANRLAQERRKFEEEKRRGLERTQSAPLAPLVITCSGQSLLPHLQPPPSPTSSIGSGRHTTRVLIKSPPPPPPPRKNTTTLTSFHSSFQPHQVSPPASPAHSSSSSSGVGSSCGSGAPPRRCKSIGSLSASSGESAVWEDSPIANRSLPVNTHPTFRSSMPPPPPPKPPAPPSVHSSSINGSPMLLGAPSPPPPPPQPTSSPPQTSLAAALNRELQRRSAQEAQLVLNGEDKTKAQLIEDKIDAFKKDKPRTGPSDPKRAQHDKLMEEFKLAHKKMFVAKDNADEESKEETKEPNVPSLPKVPPKPTPVEFSSKIISNSTINTRDGVSVNNKMIVPNQSNNVCVPKTNINYKSKFTLREASISNGSNVKETIIINSSSASNKISSSSTSLLRQQWNEQSGGSSNPQTSSEASTIAKSPLRPVSVAVMEDFKPDEKSSSLLRAPSAYFEPTRTGPGKPLVSIGAYPSPNYRPPPVKMDFLSAVGSKSELNGVSVDGSPRKSCLQQELVSTLTRSNLRQRYAPQDFPTDPPTISSSVNSASAASDKESNSAVSPSATFTTTSIQNNASSPKASLSTKYRGIRQDPSITIIMKGQQ